MFLPETTAILKELKQMDYDSLKKLWRTSDKIAQENFAWLQELTVADLGSDNESNQQILAPALFSYIGIQYQYMAPDLFTTEQLSYVQENLRILSAFYGELRPFDGITKYRLDMEDKLKIVPTKNLYEYWGDKLYQALELKDDDFVINLASEEYAKCIRPYMKKKQTFLDIMFASEVGVQLKVKATFAKIARGEMVRYLSEKNVQTIAGIKKFDHPDYTYSEELSTSRRLVFLDKK